jgi:hypothetical protein
MERAEGWAAQEDNFIAHKTYKTPAISAAVSIIFSSLCSIVCPNTTANRKHFVLLFLSFFLLLGGAKKFNQVALVSAHAPASRANFHEISREIAVEKKFRFGNCKAENFRVPLTTINRIYGQRMSPFTKVNSLKLGGQLPPSGHTDGPSRPASCNCRYPPCTKSPLNLSAVHSSCLLCPVRRRR